MGTSPSRPSQRHEADKRNTAVLLGAGLAAACLFGAAAPASKLLLDGVHPQALAGLLYIGAAIGVVPLLAVERSFRMPWRADRRTVLLLAGAVALGGVMGPWLLLLGLRASKAGSVSLLLNLELVATVLLGRFVFREHVSARAWIGAGGTLSAACMLALGEGSSGAAAALLVGAATLCWGFDNHFTALIDGITPAQTTFWKGIVAGLFNLIAGSVVFHGLERGSAAWIAILVGAFSYGISITLYIVAAQGLGASRSQMVFSTAPFFGLAFSGLLLRESITGCQAGAAVVVGVSLAVLFSERHAHLHHHGSMFHHHWHRHDDGHHVHDHDDGHDHVTGTLGHAHSHGHQSVVHEHAHWPDLHHRHDEESTRKELGRTSNETGR